MKMRGHVCEGDVVKGVDTIAGIPNLTTLNRNFSVPSARAGSQKKTCRLVMRSSNGGNSEAGGEGDPWRLSRTECFQVCFRASENANPFYLTEVNGFHSSPRRAGGKGCGSERSTASMHGGSGDTSNKLRQLPPHLNIYTRHTELLYDAMLENVDYTELS
ncbi:hypothetical protein INR49_000576 [Caranx melampygus]|nr:hypothetical protein INR49_000576 [Caranx melampygus]